MDNPLQRAQAPNDRPLGGLWPKVLPPPTRQRALAALAVAAVSDLLSISFTVLPPVQILVDVLTAMILWMLLGSRWPLLPAFIAEAIPVLSIFPTWTMVAGAYLYASRGRSAAHQHEQHEL